MSTCPTHGTHPLPDNTLPLGPPSHDTGLTTALAAAWNACRPCQVHWRGKARRSALLTGHAATAWLALYGILAHATRQPIPSHASGLIPFTGLRPATRDFLHRLPLTPKNGPDGHPAAVWDARDLSDLLNAPDASGLLLPSLWDDALDGLTGAMNLFPPRP